MTKRRSLLVGAMLAALGVPTLAQAESVSLEEALARATGESPAVLASASATSAADAMVDSAEAKLMPRLDFSETYLRTDNPVGVFAAKLNQGKFTAADFAIPSLNDPKSYNNWITRVELKVPVIHSGVNWAGRRAAIASRDAAEHMEDFERSSVALATKKLYYTAVALSMQRKAVNAGIGKLRALEGSYQLMEAPTSASTTSYLVAKSVRENLEADGVHLDCEHKKVLRDLNTVMGDDPDAEVTPVDPLPAVADRTDGQREMRSDVAASEARVRTAKAQRDAALRRWGPNVDFFTAYDVYTGDFEDAKGSYEVGARLSWPVFDWGRHADIRATKAMRAQAEHMHRAATLRAKADLRSAETNVTSCVKRYRIVERAFGSANQALTQATTRYKEGTLPLMDYSQAIQNWVRMKINLIENRLNVANANAEYDFQRNSL